MVTRPLTAATPATPARATDVPSQSRLSPTDQLIRLSTGVPSMPPSPTVRNHRNAVRLALESVSALHRIPQRTGILAASSSKTRSKERKQRQAVGKRKYANVVEHRNEPRQRPA